MGQQGALPRKVIGAAQKRLHLGQKDAEIKGLGDEIIRPRIQRAQDVEIIARRGDEQDGRRADFADLGAPVIPVKKKEGRCPSAQAGDQRRQIRAARFENPPPRAPPCPSGPCRRTGFR